MSSNATFVTPLAKLHAALSAAVRNWTGQLRAESWPEGVPPSAHPASRVELTPVTSGLLDLRPILTAMSIAPTDERAATGSSPPTGASRVAWRTLPLAMRCKFYKRFANLAAEMAATSGPLWSGLSDLAWETARTSLLFPTGDTCAVSAHGAFGALAFANFLFLFERLRTNPKQRLSIRVLKSVIRPLKAADHLPQPWEPGDFWVWLTIARTAAHAFRKVAAKYPNMPAADPSDGLDLPTLCRVAAPWFIRRSTLCKLIDAPRLPPLLAQRAQYQALPGLATLVAAPQARAARRLLTAELAFNLSTGTNNITCGATLRWLEGLRRLPADLQLPIGLNLAHFLWEVLEFGESGGDASAVRAARPDAQAAAPALGILERLVQDAIVGKAVREALAVVHRAFESAERNTHLDVANRLWEVRDCLRCYAEFRRVTVGQFDTAPAASPPSPGSPES